MTQQWVDPNDLTHPLPRVKIDAETFHRRFKAAMAKLNRGDYVQANQELDKLISEAERALWVTAEEHRMQQRFKEP